MALLIPSSSWGKISIDTEGMTDSEVENLIKMCVDLEANETMAVADAEAKTGAVTMADAEPTRSQERSFKQTRKLIDFFSLILPRKITDECFGDLLESLDEMAESMPPWRLQLKAVISVGWALLFTLRELGKPGVVLAVIWRLIFG